MTRVFISYSRKDLVFVEHLAADLKAAGLDVWYDLSGLDGGTRWGREIQSAIQQSDSFVVVLSPNSIESEWVEKEFMYANSLKRKIIPLLYQPCETPMWFINLHFIDVQGNNYDKNFWVILKAMGVKPGGIAGKGPSIPLAAAHEASDLPSPTPLGARHDQKKGGSHIPGFHPAWIIAILAIFGLTAFAIWGIPALTGRFAPAAVPTATETLTTTNMPVPSDTPAPTAQPTKTPLPSPSFTASPTLDPAYGMFTGFVNWGFERVEGVLVTLCSDWVYTCKGTHFGGVTNANGFFTIGGITPGDYQLITKYPGQADETRQGSTGGWPLSIRITAGQVVQAENISICKNELDLYSPTIKGNAVTFVWKAYPEADSYEGYVAGHPSWSTSSTSYTMNLVPGNYQLLVDVKTRNLACVRGYVNFVVP